MGFIPRSYGEGGLEDAFWFAVAPITTVPMALYVASATVSDDWRYGRPDWKANLRNAGIWAAIAQGVYSWNQYYHAGKYSYMSASAASKLAAHSAASTAVILPVLAVAAAIGWAATGEIHGAVTPGVASGIGMPMTPELYSGGTSSNPAGWDFGGWLDRLF